MQFFLVYFSLCQVERGRILLLYSHTCSEPGTYIFVFFFFFFLKHVHVLFLHAGDTVHSMCLFICAADRRLKMTVNEGLIPLGTLQNPIPSTEISSFQLSYLSYLFIFSQPGLMLPPLSLFLVSSLSHSYFLCTLICFFPLSLSPLATREPVSHFDWQHSSGLRKSGSFFFPLSLFFWSGVLVIPGSYQETQFIAVFLAGCHSGWLTALRLPCCSVEISFKLPPLPLYILSEIILWHTHTPIHASRKHVSELFCFDLTSVLMLIDTLWSPVLLAACRVKPSIVFR